MCVSSYIKHNGLFVALHKERLSSAAVFDKCSRLYSKSGSPISILAFANTPKPNVKGREINKLQTN